MFNDTLLAILKLTSILLAGIMGTIALLVDFKDKGGRITKWGRGALIGVVASTLIAATIHGIEGYRRGLEAKAASERNESLLTEIRRGVYLLKNVSVSATVDYPRPRELTKLLSKARQYGSGNVTG
jgi:hypothetical protein